MQVLITGAGGQLGQDLVDAFDDHRTTALTRAQLDVGDEASVAATVEELRPDLVVNAGAWTDVDGCEADPDRAHRDNALGPWWLARACAREGATLVTYSTDYVFGGTAPLGPGGEPRGWTEWDPVAPLNVYGRSKVAGEQLVREALPQHHIVRTAWVAGARGRNFVTAILGAGIERGTVGVVEGQIGSPTATRDLAAATRQLAVSGRYGTVNLVNEGWCDRRELAAAIFELAGVEAEVTDAPDHVRERPASRPPWSVLDTTHARAMGVELPHWRAGLAALLSELGHRAVS